MIEQLLPEDVATSDAYEDPDPASVMLPEEVPVVARAVEKRRREFATVRACARRALAELDVAPVPILPGHRGAPQFPEGITGAMTHCDGYRAAALARRFAYPGMGIDAEPAAAMPDGMLDAVSLPRERRRHVELSRRYPGVPWDRLLFSAKESVFKVWYPIVGTELGFEDALIALDPTTGTFTARLLVPGLELAGLELQTLVGHWICARGLVVTAIALSAVDGQCSAGWDAELGNLVLGDLDQPAAA